MPRFDRPQECLISLARGGLVVMFCASLVSGCGGGSAAAPPAQGGSPQPSGSANFPSYLNCTTPPVQIGQTVYELVITGSEGASFGALSNASGQYYKFTLVTPTPSPPPTPSPSPTPTPSSTPTPTPTPTASPTPFDVPVYLYEGTYTIGSAVAPTTGCFVLVTTTDGSVLYPHSSFTYSALAGGEPNGAGIAPFTLSGIATGSLTAINLSLTSAGTGSGSFTLDNGDTGTVSIGARASFEYSEALRRFLPAHAPGKI